MTVGGPQVQAILVRRNSHEVKHTRAVSFQGFALAGLTDLGALPCVESDWRGPLDFMAARGQNDDKRDLACA